ncbi:hypothetical protein Hanom_Chr03g00233641 [Helianthus anomalus]
MASERFVALLVVLIIASSISTHAIRTGGRRILESYCTTTCCSDVDCDVFCSKPGSSAGLGICKPDDACVSGGVCCCNE